VSQSNDAMDEGRPMWLLLIYQLPPEPAYARVKVSRRLKQIGARPLKSSVYVLPRSDEALEDFQWLANEIVGDGGDASICAASMLSGITDDDLAAQFGITAASPADEHPQLERPVGATWVTRKDIFVDRMASAWLIRRFIDPQAAFRFVDAGRAKRVEGQLRFDMYQGEFTHEGDRCTFETLLARFGLRDAALRAIAEIVHDVDLKDEKYRRHEAAMVRSLLLGVKRAAPADEDRLALSGRIFDTLYESLSD